MSRNVLRNWFWIKKSTVCRWLWWTQKSDWKNGKNIQIIQNKCISDAKKINSKYISCTQSRWPMTMLTAKRWSGRSRTSILIFNQFLNIKIFYGNAVVHVLHLWCIPSHCRWVLSAFHIFVYMKLLLKSIQTTDDAWKTKVGKGISGFADTSISPFHGHHVKIQYVTTRWTTWNRVMDESATSAAAVMSNTIEHHNIIFCVAQNMKCLGFRLRFGRRFDTLFEVNFLCFFFSRGSHLHIIVVNSVVCVIFRLPNEVRDGASWLCMCVCSVLWHLWTKTVEKYWSCTPHKQQAVEWSRVRERETEEIGTRNPFPKFNKQQMHRVRDHAKLLNIHFAAWSRLFIQCGWTTPMRLTRSLIVSLKKNLLSAFECFNRRRWRPGDMHFIIQAKQRRNMQNEDARSHRACQIISHYYAPFSDLRSTHTEEDEEEWTNLHKSVYAIH